MNAFSMKYECQENCIKDILDYSTDMKLMELYICIQTRLSVIFYGWQVFPLDES